MSIEIYDTTLRDGAQGVGINFSVSDKLRIAEHLDTLGVTVIEGGWPGANPTDTEFFAAMRTRPLRNATLAAFGATRRAGVRPQDDAQLRTLLDSMAPMVTLVGKTWDLQVVDVLRTTTGTFGVRALTGERWPAARMIEPVDVAGLPVRVKVGGGRVKAEFDDVVRVAAETGLSTSEVASRAEQAWRERSEDTRNASGIDPSDTNEPA